MAGAYLKGYCSGSERSDIYTYAGFYPDSDNGIALFGGRQASVTYAASYQIEFYEELAKVILVESYNFGSSDPSAITIAYPELFIQTVGGAQNSYRLRDFTPTRDPVIRETEIYSYGKENQPGEMWIEVRLVVFETFRATAPYQPYNLPNILLP